MLDQSPSFIRSLLRVACVACCVLASAPLSPIVQSLLAQQFAIQGTTPTRYTVTDEEDGSETVYGSIQVQVKNTTSAAFQGSAPYWYSDCGGFTCTPVGYVYSLAPGATTTFSLDFPLDQYRKTGYMKFVVAKNSPNESSWIRSDSILIHLTIGSNNWDYTAQVEPYAAFAKPVFARHSGLDSVTANASGTESFAFTNTGNVSATYSFALQCSGQISGCSNTPSTVTAAQGASQSTTVSFGTGAPGTTGTIRMIVTGPLSSSGQSQVDTSTITVASKDLATTPRITVTPATNAIFSSASAGSVRIEWCDIDDAIVSRTVTWHGQTLPNTFTQYFGGQAPTPGCAFAGYSVYTDLVLNPWQQDLVVSGRDQAGHVTTKAVTYTYSVPLTEYRPTVTATADLHRLAQSGGAAAADTFTISNPHSTASAFALTALCGGTTTLTNCVVTPGSVSLAANGTTEAVITYTRTGATDVLDTLKLAAAYTSPLGGTIADTGRKVVVSPSREAEPIVTGSGIIKQYDTINRVTIESFTITNPSSVPLTYSLSAAFVGPFEANDFVGSSETPHWTISVPAGQSALFYTNVRGPTVPGQSGSMTLFAVYKASTGGTLAGSARNYMVSSGAPPSSGSQVTIGSSSVSLAPGRTSRVTFTVTNAGTSNVTVTYSKECSGAAIVGCDALSAAGAAIAAGGQASVSLDVTTAAGPGSIGTIALTATAGSVTTQGTITVSIGTVAGPITLAPVQSLNPGTAIARDQCLTIAAGDDAAYECGDLRLVHPLPTTTTMNKARTPTLIYTSAHAKPLVLVASNVTLDLASPSLAGACPTQVTATVRFKSGAAYPKTFTWNGACGQSATRRIVVPVDIGTYNTGTYRYDFEVSTSANGTSWTATDTGQTLAVVNRALSPFGPGWWLDGLEQLAPVSGNQFFWIGGDGSTRVYTLAAPDVFVVQPTVDRPDTLLAVRLGQDIVAYRRRLRNGAYVEFDAFFHHSKTVNSLGHVTTFSWSSERLDSVELPVPNSVTQTPESIYSFSYTNGLLTSVTAPLGNNGPRLTTLSRGAGGGGLELAVSDPGAVQPVKYTSDATGRVTARTNRLFDPTVFTYDDSSSLMTASTADVSRTEGAGKVIQRAFCPAEAASVATCNHDLIDPSGVRTVYDGPRPSSDVADITAFYVTRFGSPSRIVNALGEPTTIERTDARWPVLATAVVSASGHRVESSYTERGLIQATRDSSALGDGRVATTSYQWNALFDKLDMITHPEGETTQFHYFNNGDREWEQDGRGEISRTSFTYNSSRQLETILHPDNRPSGKSDRIDYEARLGNLSKTTSAGGIVVDHLSDLLGRDTLVVSPTDAAQTAGLKQNARAVYDILDRVDTTVTSGLSGSQLQSLKVANTYDAENQLIKVTRTVAPDPLNLIAVSTAWDFDAAGRKTREFDPERNVTAARWKYDESGNMKRFTRGNNVIDVTVDYDALNRMIHRVVPDVQIDTTHTITDDQTFTYDVTGGMTRANNFAARVSRTHNPNGSVATDTLHVATADLGEAESTRFSRHTYVVGYTYDLTGRRKTMTPASSFGLSTVTYDYDEMTGALKRVSDGTFGAFSYFYTNGGLLDSLAQSDGTGEKHHYDDDGREISRTEFNPVAGLLHSDMASLDARGKKLSIGTGGAGGVAGEVYSYDALGGVTSTQNRTTESTPRDALGNMLSHFRSGEPFDEFYAYTQHTTQLRFSGKQLSDNRTTDSTDYRYSDAGDVDRSFREIKGPVLCLQDGVYSPCPARSDLRLIASSTTANSYDASGRLTFAEKTTTNDNSGLWIPGRDPNAVQAYPELERGVAEAYRYDALGRRVFVRAIRNPYCLGANDRDSTATCISTIERSVYDGDQVLVEIRQPGDDNVSASVLESDGIAAGQPSQQFGTVAYLHGPTIDHPLALIRNYDGALTPVVLHYSWTHGLDLSTRLNGTLLGPCTTVCSGDNPDWAGRRMTYGFVIPSSATGPVSWWGTMANQKQNATGGLDMRNRVYDPRTGRFTQEDPIGLAGGMNVYGFADGDPANNSDPFGLCCSDSFDPKMDRYITTKDPRVAMMAAGAIVGVTLAGPLLIEAAATTVFWSGEGAEAAATEWATANGGRTLGMTRAGRAVEAASEGVDYLEMRPRWVDVSREFAAKARGAVHVFQNAKGVSLESVWREEFKILTSNKNVADIIFHVIH